MTKKVLLIHTGGTIGMAKDESSGLLRTDVLYDSITRFIPELSKIADIDIEIPYMIDSSELTADHLRKIVRVIKKNVDKYSGFVISHGTDTLAYTASALSYMLMNLNFPVILTGAQKPLSEIRSDARSNLINAVELSTMNIKEVAILFDDKLMRGNRTIKSHVNHFDAFSSPNYPLLAKTGINIEVYRKNILKHDGLFHIFEGFDNSVAVMKVFPGFSHECFDPGENIRAVIIIGYGAGTVPVHNSGIAEKVEKWLSEDKLVVLMSETKAGGLDPRLYESGKKLLEAGVVDSGDMTFEAAITKIMFLLGQYKDVSIIKKNFKNSLAGEIS
ncbi:MAG: asparaginase [Acidobacteriota bacterium]